MPTRVIWHPIESSPEIAAYSIISDDVLGSLPTTTSWYSDPTARPMHNADSEVISVFTTPRIPLDPNFMISLNRNALCKVSRLVDLASSIICDIVRE